MEDGNAAPPSRSAVEIVRDATRDHHRRLEALPSQERLLRDDYRPQEYRWLLQRLYGFYVPLELALRGNEAWGERGRDRIALLASDLGDLGLTPADLQALPRCQVLPLVDSLDRVLGCLYVIEGATLGGCVIAKQLERTFRDFHSVPTRFFSGDGDRTKHRWRESCATTNAAAEDVREVCAAACATFDAMAGWLAEPALEGTPA